MQQKEPEELLEIWKQNDREQWTDVAFGVIEEILMERLGTVPPQGGEPEEVTEQALSTYHDPEVMGRVSALAKTVAGVVLVASVVIWLVTVIGFASYNQIPGRGLVDILSYGLRSGTTLIWGLFYYVVLRFLSEAAYILMDIEDNTRGSDSGQASDEPS
jgi:hypothetical protein